MTTKAAKKATATKKKAEKKTSAKAPAKTSTLIDDDALPRGMGNPARNALAAVGVTTLSQAARFSAAELLAIHGVGKKAVAVLTSTLAARGLALRG